MKGDLTMAAEKITPEAINFMAKFGRGLICLAMTPERLDELQIPLMVSNNGSRFETAFCVSIEASERTTSGISAADRAATVLAAIDPATKPAGRGMGLANTIRAYSLQDAGFDTVEANERFGFKPDEREYGIGVQILREIGVRSIRLLSNNPRKPVAIEGYGLSVTERLPLEIPASASALGYLTAKRNKLGHALQTPD